MPKRHPNETILASWLVDATTWRNFVRSVRAHDQQPGYIARSYWKFKDESPGPADVEVVIRDDAFFVGSYSLGIAYAPTTVTFRPEWLEFQYDQSEGPSFIVPVPVPPAARAQAARMAEYFTQKSQDAAQKNAESARKAAEERARPTLSNRLLNALEGHFILCMLLFFFVQIPGIVGIIYLVRRWKGLSD